MEADPLEDSTSGGLNSLFFFFCNFKKVLNMQFNYKPEIPVRSMTLPLRDRTTGPGVRIISGVGTWGLSTQACESGREEPFR